MWSEILAERREPRDWGWLYRQSRAVALLAQAGSGKTVEFQHQVDTIRARKEEAFFFRVERLCAAPLHQAHETKDCERRFDRWVKSARLATIFLDSVDEAKLPRSTTARPLQRALGELERVLEPHLGRIHLIVSCRSTEWHSRTEQEVFQAIAAKMASPPLRGEDTKPVTVLNLTFDALDLSRIELLANSRGVADGFIASLVASDARRDIVTPLDAIHYADAYTSVDRSNDRTDMFGTRGRILEASVSRRLADLGTDVQRIDLNPLLSLSVVRYIAFALMMAQQRDIGIEGGAPDALDPFMLMQRGPISINATATRQLLATSLFVPSGQGRVRFYRPEIVSMLAAQWLRERIDEGASAHALADQFMPTSFGKPIVPQAYGGMLAWLASYDSHILRRILAAGPEWLIEDGDPKSLALEDRITAIDRHIALGEKRLQGGFHFDRTEIPRFAVPAMEAAIVERLAVEPDGEILHHLIQLAEIGSYKSAAPHLVAMLVDPMSSSDRKIYAVRALATCGGTSDLEKVAKAFITAGPPAKSTQEHGFEESRADFVRLQLVFSSYPSAITLNQALALLGQLHGKRHSSEASSVADFIAQVPESSLQQWAQGLDSLCFEGDASAPFGHDIPEFTKRGLILLKGLHETVVRLISEGISVDEPWMMAIYDRVERSQSVGRDHGLREESMARLRVAVSANAVFRRALYHAIAKGEDKGFTASTYLRHIQRADHEGAGGQGDLDWLMPAYRAADVGSRADFAESVEHLRAYLPVPRRAGVKLRLLLNALIHRTGIDWATVKMSLIGRLIWKMRHARARYKYRRPMKERITSFSATIREEVTDYANYLRHWRAIPRGEPVNLIHGRLFANFGEVPSQTGAERRLGRFQARRFIKAAIAHARRYDPPPRSGYYGEAEMLALAGYHYSWSIDPALPGIEVDKALTAALAYADDWPGWAEALALRHPDKWRAAVMPILQQEMSDAASRPFDREGYYMRRVGSRSEELRTIIAPGLLEIARGTATIADRDVPLIAHIVGTHRDAEAGLTIVARKRALFAWSAGEKGAALAWLEVWARSDAAALAALADWLEAVPDVRTEGLFLVSRLHGREERRPLPDIELSVRLRLAELAFAHIALGDDEPRVEGVRQVTGRHDLEQVRQGILSLLEEHYSDEARLALQAFVAKHIAPYSSRWADKIMAGHAHKGAKPQPWRIEDIAQFAADQTETPMGGASLMRKVTALIADLENELATGEFDRRGLFDSRIRESYFRAWLAHALDQRRRSWFSVTQETQTAREGRTDIRLEQRSGGNAVVVIEIKLAHAWTYAELLDKIESQLIERYLMSDRVAHGIYLIVDLGKKPKGAMPDGSKPSVHELVDLLEEKARRKLTHSGCEARAQIFRIETPLSRSLF
jgi:hypothetical protein